MSSLVAIIIVSLNAKKTCKCYSFSVSNVKILVYTCTVHVCEKVKPFSLAVLYWVMLCYVLVLGYVYFRGSRWR